MAFDHSLHVARSVSLVRVWRVRRRWDRLTRACGGRTSRLRRGAGHERGDGRSWEAGVVRSWVEDLQFMSNRRVQANPRTYRRVKDTWVVIVVRAGERDQFRRVRSARACPIDANLRARWVELSATRAVSQMQG